MPFRELFDRRVIRESLQTFSGGFAASNALHFNEFSGFAASYSTNHSPAPLRGELFDNLPAARRFAVSYSSGELFENLLYSARQNLADFPPLHGGPIHQSRSLDHLLVNPDIEATKLNSQEMHHRRCWGFT